MKNLIITALAVVISQVSFSQHEIGIRGGLAGSQITAPNGEGKLGTYFNVNYGYRLTKHFSLGTGVEIEKKGDIHITNYSSSDGTAYRSESDLELEYYSIPLFVQYRFGNKLFGAVNAGLVGRYLDHAIGKTTVNSNDTLINFCGTATANNYKKFDLASLVELSGGYSLNGGHVISLTARLSHGLININQYLTEHVSQKRNRGVLLALGYTYRF